MVFIKNIVCFLLIYISPCLADTIYVDCNAPGPIHDGSSWENAFLTIQEGINDANNGDTVIVAEGTYTGDGNRDIDFLGKGITVRSVEPSDPVTVASTIIDCNGSEAEPHRGFCFRSNEGQNSVLDGLTITKGFAPASENFLEDLRGGAIMCNSSSPKILNCIVLNNKSESGGGIYCYHGCPIISNCMIKKNTASDSGGGILFIGGEPTVLRCLIENNSAQECGGIGSHRSNVSIKECLVINNSCQGLGGGICLNSPKYNPSWPKIESCVIRNNKARSGGGISIGNYTTSTIKNCMIVDNEAIRWSGGGLMIANWYPGSDVTIINCTICKNTALSECGGGICSMYGAKIISNCIFWGNKALDGNEIYLGCGSTNKTIVRFTNLSTDPCDVKVCPSTILTYGQGMKNLYPCFVNFNEHDPNLRDYHLLPASPCIDAGDPNFIAEPNETDLDGNPRVQGGCIDMGAYEHFYVESDLRFTPTNLNPKSKGKWIKAHFVLPQGYTIDDVDVNKPAEIWQFGIRSDSIDAFINNENLVEIVASFERSEICNYISGEQTLSLMCVVFGTNGEYFYGIDDVVIKNKHFEQLAKFVLYWLNTDCKMPDWCYGLDFNLDGKVDFQDFAQLDDCCIEILE